MTSSTEAQESSAFYTRTGESPIRSIDDHLQVRRFPPSLLRSDRAFEHVRILAQRHPRTKFVSIVGTKCIENLPDSRVPMFIIYRKGDIRNQIVAWGADRERRIEGCVCSP